MTQKIVDSWLADEKIPAGKKKIFQAAVKLFAQKGYQATTTAAIAREAGLSDATMFKHFKNKSDLLQAIITPLMQQMVPKISDHFLQQIQQQATNVRDLIAYIMRDRYQFMANNWQIILIVLDQILVNQNFRTQVLDIVQPKLNKALEILTQLLKTDQQVSSEVTATDLTHLIVGQLLVTFIQNYKLQDPNGIDARQEEQTMEKMIFWIQQAVKK